MAHKMDRVMVTVGTWHQPQDNKHYSDAVYCTLLCQTLIYDCFTANLLQNTEVCVYVDHNQWYLYSQSCFPFSISHCHMCWPFVSEYTQVEKTQIQGILKQQRRDCDILQEAQWEDGAEGREKLETALIMLPWPLRSGTGRKRTQHQTGRSIFCF